MGEHASRSTGDSAAEAIATVGLFLILSAVVATAICLASWAATDASLAALTGVIALAGFATSFVCFGVQANAAAHDDRSLALR